MTHKIGDLFIDDMGLLMMIYAQEDSHGIKYWVCDDTSGVNHGPFWYREEHVTEGKKLLDKMKEEQ